MRDDTKWTLQGIEQATGGKITHVNFGESDDYIRGFNDGFDHRRLRSPQDQPNRDAYRRGYIEGARFRKEYRR